MSSDSVIPPAGAGPGAADAQVFASLMAPALTHSGDEESADEE